VREEIVLKQHNIGYLDMGRWLWSGCFGWPSGHEGAIFL